MADFLTVLQRALGPAFRIDRELGGGGMSRVVLAEETALGRRVVVKVLTADAASAVSQQRFRQEMQLAATLQHPGIVPLLGTGSGGDLLWYTMPFVAGETLRARLDRDGALPLDDALRYAHDLFEALAVAHAAGVVHRDVKPENLLVSGRRLQVTDFGVALALTRSTQAEPDAAGRLTAMGLAIGTPAYMAPEQVLGDPAADHRVDLYAAGLVLYEMLAGRGPYGDAPGPSMARAHLSDEPAGLRAVRPEVPAALESVVLACLAKAPGDRPPGAQAVLQELERIRVKVAAAADTSPSAAPASRSAPRVAAAPGMRAALLTIGALAAATFAAWVATRDGSADTAPAPRDLLVVGDFRHADADSGLANSVREALRIDLGLSSRLRIASPQEEARTRQAMQVADSAALTDSVLEGLARRLGAKAYVQGGVARVGPGFVLTVRLVAAASGDEVAALRETARDSAEVLQAIDRLGAALRAAAGESVKELAARQPLPLVTTASLAALDAYATGVRLYHDLQFPEAVAAQRRAIAADSMFASAWRGLFEGLGPIPGTGVEALAALERAHALRLRLPEEERLGIEALWLEARLDYDEAAAVHARRQALRGGAGTVEHAVAMLNAGRPREALDSLLTIARRDVDPSPRDGGLPATLDRGFMVNAAIMSGDSILADSLLAAAGAAGDPFASIYRSSVLGVRRQYDAALNVLDSSLASPMPPEFRQMFLESRVWLLGSLGRLREMTELLSRIDASARGYGPSAQRTSGLVNAGIVAELRTALLGDTVGALRILDSAQRAFPLDSLGPIDRPYAELALAFARAGDSTTALRLLGASSTRPEIRRRHDSVFVLRARSELAMRAGDTERAIAIRRAKHPGEFLWSLRKPADLARLYDAARMDDSTLVVLERFLAPLRGDLVADAFHLAWALRRAGELYENRGDVPRAIARYLEFVRLWENADPELQPVVREVRERIVRLEARRG